ncbi:MAG: hypothetical protein R6V84_01990 [Desulfobacterales bacterium]
MGTLLRGIIVCLWICSVLGCGRSVPGVPIDPVPANVPEGYRALYRELESDLSLPNPFLKNVRVREAGAPLFGVELPATAWHRGGRLPDDAQPGSPAPMLDRLRTLGAKFVCLHLLHPVLTREFTQNESYLAFYRNIAGEIRRRGFKLVVALGVMPRESELSVLAAGTAELNRARFNSGLRQMAETILAELRPDYLTVLSEPDTVAQDTGLPFSPAEFAATVRHIVRGLDAGSTKLGAGTGTWAASDYLEEMGAIPELHYLDLRLHPVRYGFASDRISRAADIARSRGKKLSIGAAWLQKESSREFGRIARADVLAREAFSFWQPLDRRFVETVVGIARSLGAEFCSFSRTEYLFATLEYSEEADRLTPAQRMQRVEIQAMVRIPAGTLTPAGRRLRDLIAD